MPHTNAAGLHIIETFEGCSLVAYDDGTGVWTDGYGNTHNVEPGERISLAQAESDLRANVASAEEAVAKAVEVVLTPNEFSACVSLAFNIGNAAFADSTLCKLLNEADYAGAAAQFVRWDDPGTNVTAGLLRRRLAEKALFLS